MKLNISGKDMTKKDLINICKFFADYWKNRKDNISIFVSEGTEDYSKEELMGVMVKIFEGRPYFTKIFEIKKK